MLRPDTVGSGMARVVAILCLCLICGAAAQVKPPQDAPGSQSPAPKSNLESSMDEAVGLIEKDTSKAKAMAEEVLASARAAGNFVVEARALRLLGQVAEKQEGYPK